MGGSVPWRPTRGQRPADDGPPLPHELVEHRRHHPAGGPVGPQQRLDMPAGPEAGAAAPGRTVRRRGRACCSGAAGRGRARARRAAPSAADGWSAGPPAPADRRAPTGRPAPGRSGTRPAARSRPRRPDPPASTDRAPGQRMVQRQPDVERLAQQRAAVHTAGRGGGTVSSTAVGDDDVVVGDQPGELVLRDVLVERLQQEPRIARGQPLDQSGDEAARTRRRRRQSHACRRPHRGSAATRRRPRPARSPPRSRSRPAPGPASVSRSPRPTRLHQRHPEPPLQRPSAAATPPTESGAAASATAVTEPRSAEFADAARQVRPSSRPVVLMKPTLQSRCSRLSIVLQHSRAEDGRRVQPRPSAGRPGRRLLGTELPGDRARPRSTSRRCSWWRCASPWSRVPTLLLVPRPAVKLRWLIGTGLGIGVLQFAFLYLGMAAGMPSGLASLVLQASAPFTVLLGRDLPAERLSRRQVVGIVRRGGRAWRRSRSHRGQVGGPAPGGPHPVRRTGLGDRQPLQPTGAGAQAAPPDAVDVGGPAGPDAGRVAGRRGAGQDRRPR